jgi:hypothetical protein
LPGNYFKLGHYPELAQALERREDEGYRRLIREIRKPDGNDKGRSP